MIVIRFPDAETERKALGFLATRYSIKTWKTGETMVPEAALAALAHERISYSVEGPPSYEQSVPAVRDSASTSVQ